MPSLVKRKYKSGKHCWRIHYRQDRIQRVYKIGNCDKRTARQVYHKVCALIADGKLRQELNGSKMIEEFISDYLDHCNQVKAPRTVIRERRILLNLLEFAGNVNIRSIRPLTMENYRKQRLDNGISPSTVNLEFRHLKVAFNTAVRWELLDKNPLANIRYIRVPQSEYPKYLSLEEVLRVKAAFKNTSFSQLVDFYLTTGARLGEALSLIWDDIDFRGNQIIIRGVNAKGKRHRIIPFRYSPALKDILKSMKKRDDGKVFGPSDVNGKELPQWRKWWVGRFISKTLTSIGLPWATCHTFRHTFASHLAMMKVPIFTLQNLLGHTQIETTMIYSHLAVDHKDEMMGKLPY